jgi:PAS domain S-box-containing protein
MVTALGQKENLVSGLAYADDYIKKPFIWEELQARIAAFRRTQLLQRELVEARNRYECHYENMPHMCISLDKNLRILNCNAQFRRKYGAGKADIIGKNFLSLFADEDKVGLEAYLTSMSVSQSEPDAQEPVFTMAVGGTQAERLKVIVKAVSVIQGQSDVSVVIAIEDVTHSLQMEEEQKLARMQLYRSARLASIGTLASGVAHEMNNPLTAILGFSSALIERMNAGETLDKIELRQYLDIIHSEALRCRDIVENLSQFARDRGSSIESVPLYSCVESAMKLLKNSAQKKNTRLEVQVDPVALVMADAQKLEQAIIHVVSNSIEFSAPGSLVTIRSSIDTGRPDHVKLSITDNGPGIPQEIQPRVFDPFFTTKGVGQGAGFGLAIAHNIIEEFNGSIDIISGAGEGTTVIFKIPKGI